MADYRAHRPLEYRPGGPLEPVAKVLRELDNSSPWRHSKRIAATFDGASSTVDVEHGLGRAYTGGVLDGAPDASVLRVVVDPDTALAAGVDITTHVRLAQDTPATAETVYVRVY